ncbi:molybdopterin/thiamine biosynthesis adenylyltransferase/rhodanese-related sulfurtransferase [Roseateles asaccharophilus]|uniref:ThiF family adenylyltransferase n=1 Tax=Roseateles asaccharophilus TaxID=582607 RepID=UPI003838F163
MTTPNAIPESIPDSNPNVPMVSEDVFYARHLKLPGFNRATQERLRKARVLIVGVGGLGCPAALYLAGAGVGHIALCDADAVSATNLHRQVLFTVADVGRKKVEVAAERLSATNPHISILQIPRFADEQLLAELVPKFDLVLDGTDNFSAKYEINDACEAAGVPLVYGSIFQFEGQVSLFHAATEKHPTGISYRDLYPTAPPAGLSQNCGEAGVIGVLPGIIGTLQANEAIKHLAGLGETLSGTLVIFDALTARMQRFALARRSKKSAVVDTMAGQITADELQVRLAGDRKPLLLDVRDDDERARGHLGGLHIPLMSLPPRLSELQTGQDIVAYCKSGVRSAKAALYLRSVLPGVQIYSLEGGIEGPACALMAA